jgi:hypothetical protein
MDKTCTECGSSSSEVPFPKHRNQCRPCWRRINRDRMREYRYGITPDELEVLRETQAGLCGICRRRRKLVIDHCHESGAVRGLLCHACNTAIGSLDEDPRIIHAAVRYVITHSGLRINQEEG